MDEEIIESNNITATIVKLLTDGAYDSNDIFKCLSDNGILSCIKVRNNARVKLKTNHLLFRNFSVLAQRIDLQRWKDNVGYRMRWIVETVFFSIKRMFGEYVYSAKFKNMIKELMLKTSLYNKFASF